MNGLAFSLIRGKPQSFASGLIAGYGFARDDLAKRRQHFFPTLWTVLYEAPALVLIVSRHNGSQARPFVPSCDCITSLTARPS